MDHLKEILKSRKLKATQTRLQLLSIFDQEKYAVPYSKIQILMKETDRVTLYRTIETLLEKGVIHKAYREENDNYFAMCGQSCSQQEHNHDHVHFKCQNCNEVQCKEIDQKINIDIPGYKVNTTSVVLQGICNKCQ